MIRSLWKRMNCPHRTGRTISISYDGVTTVECTGCKTLFHIPLSGCRIKPGIAYRARRAMKQQETSHDNQ